MTARIDDSTKNTAISLYQLCQAHEWLLKQYLHSVVIFIQIIRNFLRYFICRYCSFVSTSNAFKNNLKMQI